MEAADLFEELLQCKDDTLVFKKLINFAASHSYSSDDESLKKWEPIFIHIIETFIPSVRVEKEKTLLASHAFFALLSTQSTLNFFKSSFVGFLNLSTNRLMFFGNEYNVEDLELFKLTCIHGYLQVNRKEIYYNDILLAMFDIIYRNCMQYTRYCYFAYKVLYMWLNKTTSTDFWMNCDPQLEKRLETIIFSNWSNAINEISKQNCTIFNMYLQVMSSKYNDFLESVFKHCVDNMSWQNEIKYVILAEICDLWGNVEVMTSQNFLLYLSSTLTKNYLRHAGTKVYVSIAKKLSEDKWKESFGLVMKSIFHQWESDEKTNYNALQLLCKHWLEPTIKKNKDILVYLWELSSDVNGYFLRSHLRRIACEMNVVLPEKEEIEYYINHKDEIVRLNGFAINCYRVNADENQTRDEKFVTMKNFFWYNANSTSVRMRDGIVKYFKTYLGNALRISDSKPDYMEDVYYITNWLHEFLLDCFEIGSCYQRKIFGLNLYEAVLCTVDKNAGNKLNLPRAKCVMLLQKRLRADIGEKFTNKTSWFSLLKLVLDSALDIRQLATSIILEYFDIKILTDSEIHVLYDIAWEYCNSSKFYRIESGAAVITILANWLTLDTLQSICAKFENNEQEKFIDSSTYSELLLNEAGRQLEEMKEDILKAIVRNKPFYGALTALLKITFRDGPESSLLTLGFVEKVLQLLKDAVEFFLSLLSSKSTNTEYSSSFAEMGQAIDEAIKTSEVDDINYDELNLTPAHQVLISCIWMSLKVSCEIACEIGTVMYSYETVKDSANIIVTVLFRCRHKGVVESAGTAIGNLTRSLCKHDIYVDIPKMYIRNILQNDAMKCLNITRRGAGLSIMFHKIVVADNRRDRPLLHFAVRMLLDLLNDYSDACSEYVESQHDSPWARRLHFLRALVADKEIHAQLTPYMERISLTCFRYLESEVWTIRNASLQLFGAIMPRLVGQSYGETFLDFGIDYPINHFVTHYPMLAEYVMNQLEEFSSAFTMFSSSLHLHSRIVHVLILISKFSCGGSELIDYSSKEFILKAKSLLHTLFNDPISYVRMLAAKAYAALTAFSSIQFEVEQLTRVVPSIHKPNLIHGYLLTIKYLKEKLAVEMETSNATKYVSNNFKESIELSRFRRISKTWTSEGSNVKQPCYVLETLFLELSDSILCEISEQDIMPLVRNPSILSDKVQPGFSQFVDLSMKLYANHVKRSNNFNVEILRKVLDSSCIDQRNAFLNYLSPYAPAFEIILEHLLSMRGDHNELLLHAMIDFILKTLRYSLLEIDESKVRRLMENVSVKIQENMSHSNLWRLKCILTILFSDDEILIQKILSYILEISVNEEEHIKQMAVEFMEFSAYRFARLNNTNKLTVVQCCLILLKDEIAEIRETIAESLRQYVLPRINEKYDALQHDEVIYQCLLHEIMLDSSCFGVSSKEKNLHFINLFTRGIKSPNINTTIENPFYHDDNPFYREESKFLNICFLHAKCTKQDYVDERRFHELKRSKENNICRAITVKHDIVEKIHFDSSNLREFLNIKYADYLLRKRGAVIQEYS